MVIACGPFFKIKNTLTLALSRRERGLNGVIGRSTPAWDIELNANTHKIKSPSP